MLFNDGCLFVASDYRLSPTCSGWPDPEWLGTTFWAAILHASRYPWPVGADSVVYNPFPSLHTLRRRKAFATVGSTRNPANARGEEVSRDDTYTPLMHESSSSGDLDCLNTPHSRTICSHERPFSGSVVLCYLHL